MPKSESADPEYRRHFAEVKLRALMMRSRIQPNNEAHHGERRLLPVVLLLAFFGTATTKTAEARKGSAKEREDKDERRC